MNYEDDFSLELIEHEAFWAEQKKKFEEYMQKYQGDDDEVS